MPRQPRIVIPDIPHHVTQRGNYKQTVFEQGCDFEKYISWLNEYSRKYNLDVLAYCLMSNHVHFIVVPREEDSLARVFNTLHMRYAQYINYRNDIKGHLWQSRFFSCLLDDTYLYRAIRYVERNPVRAKIVDKAWDYPWSSARAHIGLHKDTVITLNNLFDMSTEEWKEYLTEGDTEIMQEIRLKTARGLVVGTEIFIKQLENILKRSLACQCPGRPMSNKSRLKG